MQKQPTYYNSIISKQGGKPRDWENLLKSTNTKTDEAKSMISELSKKFKENTFPNHLLLLDILDYLVDFSKSAFINLVAAKDFMTSLLFLLKIKDKPVLQSKVLYLVKKWAAKFPAQKIFSDTFNTLTKSGVVFPENFSVEYTKFIKPNEVNEVNKKRFENYIEKPENEQIQIQTVIKFGEVFLDLNPNNYERRYKKFVSELSILLDNMKLTNDMIDNSNHNAPLDEGIQFIVDLLKDLEKNLAKAIENDIEDEKLLAICLGINDDIKVTFKRYDELANKRKPPVFISCFLTDYRSYNLNLEGAHDLDFKKNKDCNLLESFDNLNIKNQDADKINNNNDVPKDIFDIFK